MTTPASVPGMSRRTLLTIYDLLHLFMLHGSRLSRGRVLDYLARAMGNTECLPKSRMRAFERLKSHMTRLGIAYHYEGYAGGVNSTRSLLFVVPCPGKAKRKVEALLDRSAKPVAERESA